MRVVVLADIHSHAFAQFATILPGGRNSRLQAVLDAIEGVAKFCQQNEVEGLFMLGDLFHSRTKIEVDTYSSTWLAVKALCESVDYAFLLVGNHDQASQNGRIHSLEAFREFAHVIDQPTIERVGPITFAAHPFTTNMQRWNSFVKMMPSGLDFFLFHQGISEAQVGAYNISIKAEVSYTDLPVDKARWLLGGHYHRHQWLGDKGVGYVGSLLQHNFGEKDEQKGFLYFEHDTKPPKFISSSAPEFVEYDSGESFYEDMAARAQDPQAPWNCGDYIKVVECTQEEVDFISKEFPQIQVEGIKETKHSENRITDEMVTSDRKLLEAFIDQTKTVLDKEALMRVGLEMLDD